MKSIKIRSELLCSVAIVGVLGAAAPALAQSQGAALAQAAPDTPPPPKAGAPTLSEVVVTAQKREQRLQDVPVPVTVISPQTLAQTGEVRLQEYYSSIPGFTLSPSGTVGNEQTLVIRGISSGSAQNSTVGITVDDVPFGSNSSYAGNITPDFDPSDLADVEVLRGPQGTLYGASSMGGLLKFTTVDPSVAGVSGRIQADVNTVYNGAEPGYSFRGAINIPVTNDLAVRASGFTRQDAGYIDNPLQNKTGVNEDHVYGGRVSALWSPSRLFKLKLSALYQDTRGDSTSEVDLQPGLKDLQQNPFPGCCGYNKTLQAYSAIITSKLGIVNLTSVTGYNVSTFNTTLDYSYLLSALSEPLFGTDSVRYHPTAATHKFSQEVRADIPIGQTFDWLVGGFYQHEVTSYQISIPAVNASTGTPIGNIASLTLPYNYNETAVFTDLTVHLTKQFNIQLGGRESFTSQEADTAQESGPLFGGASFVVPAVKTKPDVFTYQVTPQYTISRDMMVYVRIASGFRPGSSNVGNPDPLIPKASVPDKTVNYEVGTKGDFLEHRLTFDVSLYYIDWKNIQFQLLDPRNDLAYGSNGSSAKSEGLEISLQAKPRDGLTIGGWYSYDNAVLTQDVPPESTVYGPTGTRLPFSAHNSANLSVNQTFKIISDVDGYVGGQLSYIGGRLGDFEPTPERAVYPAYAKTDLRAGVTYKSWTATLYANNITDRRGLLGGGLGTFPPYAYYYIQPRTVGFSLAKNF